MSHQKRHANQVGSDQRNGPLIVWEKMEKRNNIKKGEEKQGVLSLWKDVLRAVCVFAYSFRCLFVVFLRPYLPSNWLNYLQSLLGVRKKNAGEFV